MLWAIDGRSIDPAPFAALRVHEVLGECDGPKTLTLIDEFDDLYLAHFCDESAPVTRFLLVPFSMELLARLKLGTLGLLDALRQPRFWIADVQHVWRPMAMWSSSLNSVPPDVLPDPSVMLWPSLEPLISLRGIGESIGEGTTPASVVADAVEGARRAMRILIEHVLETESTPGHPAELRRQWYDLPVQRIRFASFEVDFRKPIESDAFAPAGGRPLADDVYRRAGDLLQAGLAWLLIRPSREPQWRSEDERKAVLEAIESLLPSPQGPIHTLQIQGQWVANIEDKLGGVVQVKRGMKQAVRAALSRSLSRAGEIVSMKGYIRELDKDRLRFELRDDFAAESASRQFSFGDDLADDVDAALFLNALVEVVGFRESPRRSVRARIIRFIDDLPAESAAPPSASNVVRTLPED